MDRAETLREIREIVALQEQAMTSIRRRAAMTIGVAEIRSSKAEVPKNAIRRAVEALQQNVIALDNDDHLLEPTR